MDRMKSHRHCLLGVALLACLTAGSLGCSSDDDDPGYLGPPLYVTAFTDVTDAAGFSGVTATYVAWGDYDGDDDEDLILDGRRLFRNNGDGTFTETTVAADIDPAGGGAGAAWADINNDGHLDLFCSGYEDATANSLDRLYLNDGDRTFTDITTAAGVSENYESRACAWGDFDGDGYVDLYVANYEDPPGSGTAAPDRLYMNDGDTTFTDATAAAGIAGVTQQVGRAVVCCDYDDDNDLDIYVANDKLGPNFLWRNNGSGVFTNAAATAEVEGTDEGSGYFGSSSGASWGDFDNDTDFDLLVTNQRSPAHPAYEDKTHFFINFTVGDFEDWYDFSYVTAPDKALCPAWLDFNNDTALDFYLCNEDGTGKLYNGHGTGAFIDVAGSAALAVQNPLGCASADYDSDGMPDIFICASDQVYLFKNNHDRFNYLRVKLTGTTANKAAIGSIVRVT